MLNYVDLCKIIQKSADIRRFMQHIILSGAELCGYLEKICRYLQIRSSLRTRR
jgi:hypothetical protein